MSKPKLFVFMVDALCESDVAYMRTLKNFGWMLENGALVREMLPVYPSFTYPCHVSIMTGCYPEKHGIPHNEQVKAGVHPVPWYISRKLVQKKFFAEYAKERGLSTCLVNWPVSAGADVDINLPMCVPMGYRGDNPRQFYEGVSSPEVLDRYFWKYGYMLCGCNKVLNGSLDDFTNAVAPDIIRDYGQPDVMFVKMCDLDSVRHKLGVDSDTAKLQLEKHDRELGVLMESIRRYGDFENTNFIVMGDHGQTDVAQVINFNRVFQDAGMQRLDENGKLEAFDAYCHSTGGSGWIELRDPNDEVAARTCLPSAARHQGEREIQASATCSPRKRRAEQFHLDRSIRFHHRREKSRCPSVTIRRRRCLRRPFAGGDYKTSPGTHGGLPWRDHRTTFFACGPAFEKGAVIDQRSASWTKRRRWPAFSASRWKTSTENASIRC